MSGGNARETVMDAFELSEDTEDIILNGVVSRKEAAYPNAGQRDAAVEEREMSEKEIFKPGNMLYPLPAVMVSCADKSGKDNILTVAWTGTVCWIRPCFTFRSVRDGFPTI